MAPEPGLPLYSISVRRLGVQASGFMIRVTLPTLVTSPLEGA
jgi:hypothetical protein